MSEDRKPVYLGPTISRRTVLTTQLIAGGLALVGCGTTQQRETPGESTVQAPDREPTPPSETPAPEEYLFFTDEEAATLEAIVARIIPGDDDDPGAIQAGVPVYIDRKLDTFETFAEPTYHQGPFAEGYEEDEEPASNGAAVPVPEAELYRYGFQSELTHPELYRTGLSGVERLAQTRYGSMFADLDGDQQDELLMVLEGVQDRSEENGGAEAGADEGANGGNGNGNGNGPSEAQMDQAEDLFDEADPGAFFEAVRLDTIEGMFSDPMYGGNRNLVGWTLIGWPGAQRSYSPDEMLYGTSKQPTSMDGLTPMNPDRADGGRDALEQPQDGVHNH